MPWLTEKQKEMRRLDAVKSAIDILRYSGLLWGASTVAHPSGKMMIILIDGVGVEDFDLEDRDEAAG